MRKKGRSKLIAESSDDDFLLSSNDLEADEKAFKSAAQQKTLSRVSAAPPKKADQRKSVPIPKQPKDDQIVDAEDQHIGGGFQNE